MAEYENDQQYTVDALAEELAMIQKHFGDGSWKRCTCIPKKHRLLIHGISIEGRPMPGLDKAVLKRIESFSKKITPEKMKSLTEAQAEALGDEAWSLRKSLGSCGTGSCELGGKSLIKDEMTNSSRESSDMIPKDWKPVAAILGGQTLGVVVEFGTGWIDDNQAVTQKLARPVGTLAGGIGAILYAVYKVKGADLKLALLSAGSHMLLDCILNNATKVPSLLGSQPTAAASFNDTSRPTNQPTTPSVQFG